MVAPPPPMRPAQEWAFLLQTSRQTVHICSCAPMQEQAGTEDLQMVPRKYYRLLRTRITTPYSYLIFERQHLGPKVQLVRLNTKNCSSSSSNNNTY